MVVLPQTSGRWTRIGRHASRTQSGWSDRCSAPPQWEGRWFDSRWHSLIACTRKQRSGASASSTTRPCTSSGPIPAFTWPSSAPQANSENCRRPSIFDSSGKAGSKDSTTGDPSFHLPSRMGPGSVCPYLLQPRCFRPVTFSPQAVLRVVGEPTGFSRPAEPLHANRGVPWRRSGGGSLHHCGENLRSVC